MATGKEILDYWTPERIRSAQAIDSMLGDIYNVETGASAANAVTTDLTSDEILAYWTPERIRSAVPVDRLLSQGSYYGVEPRQHAGEQQRALSEGAKSSYVRVEAKADSGRASGQPRVPQELTEVPASRLTTFPYQCVGRLYFTIRNLRTWTTAYHVGSNRLLTVAHALVVAGATPGSKEYAAALAFIPAMVDHEDHFGRNYGFFPQVGGGGLGTAYFPDPKFDPAERKAEHDICVVLLGVGNRGKQISRVLPPIQLLKNQRYDSKTEWNSIGYPVTNSKGRMCEISGTFVPNSLVSDTVRKHGAASPGMSGGPWILAGSGDRANGVQAGNTTLTTAISPYFRYPWMAALDTLP